MPKYKGVIKIKDLFYAYKDHKGKRYYSGKGYTTAGQAAQARLKLERELRANIRDKRDLTIQDYIELFFQKYAVNWKPGTQYDAKCKILKHIYPYLQDRKLKDIDEIDIQNIKNAVSSKYSKSYSYEIVKLTKLLFNVAMQWGLILQNPAFTIKPDRPGKRIKTKVTPEQIINLIDSLEGREKAILGLAFYAGLRLGETFGLQWSDVDFKSNQITINRQFSRGMVINPKSDTSGSTIYMLRTLNAILKAWKLQCRSNIWLFPSPYPGSRWEGQPMNPEGWQKRYFRPLIEEHGLSLRFHDLRHLHGIMLRRQGLELDDVQEQMRHATISTTIDVYGDIDRQELLKKLDRVDQYIRSLKDGHRRNFQA